MKAMKIIASTIVALALLSGCSREDPEPTPLTVPESTRPADPLTPDQRLDTTPRENTTTNPYVPPQERTATETEMPEVIRDDAETVNP